MRRSSSVIHGLGAAPARPIILPLGCRRVPLGTGSTNAPADTATTTPRNSEPSSIRDLLAFEHPDQISFEACRKDD
jgi:hypothetical protein